ncbi:hypothetical protein CDD81_5851 [Ophiocordyceps australis]|uniref:Uncharacterized protein n=1 Tax=Ophiocordyceps australis TaxID=1399860 RepID=A0A2C5XSL7_9HYPO|nr:hypothetical protein CDD81_5851 [Ophiocordyceps australis]
MAGLGTAAFAQLTTHHLTHVFNPAVPDDPAVRYFSFGAALEPSRPPPLLSPLRLPYRVVSAAEGPNDGLVSVSSSQWGEYQGTLLGVSHLDLINWNNRLRSSLRGLVGIKPSFNAVAFYLAITDMLAKEGL